MKHPVSEGQRKTNTNVSLPRDLKAEFLKYAEPMGIKISPWVQAKMKEFVEEQKRKSAQ